MNLTNVTVKLEEPLHCWLSWGRYISADFVCVLKVVLGLYTQCA